MTLHVKNPNSNKPMPVLGTGDDEGGAVHVTGPVKSGVKLADGQTVTLAADDVIDTDLDCSTLSRVMVHFTMTTNALDQFEIQGSVDGTNFVDLYTSAGEFLDPTGILVGTSGDLTIIAAGTSGWYILDCRGINTIRHTLSCSVGAGTIAMTYSGS